ncbi:tripartite tricarboxylate transporter substrate binding protein [Achromobacter pestifer]|uniref:Tripartite tricarboxylate transporter substrate binding protein n=1 Tax=Achromobacter pestifer TaxID=1353889 RepID=A0A7D4E2G9_9BURK|nr:tripartite tricarboxylate transporter substrate binding protein [Achromobacter pestifer]QKH39685.1 tripartite tricarboxylate transporter substrate binding protein [Achromobacter pestifer]
MLSNGLRLAGCALALGAALLGQGARAADYPDRPVMMMVPYPAGGASDSIARVVASPVSKQLGQPVLVENLGGVSGALGAQKVLGAKADGYYLFQGSPNELILSPIANPAVKLKSEDFRLVQMIGMAPLVIVARADLPANNADELVALAHSRSATQPLTFGSVGVGSLYHVLGEHMARTIGANMMHVPYKGGAPLMQDIGGGQVDLAILPLSQQQVALAEQGRIKLLATLEPQRSQLPSLKSVPSVNEGQLLKGFNFTTWTGYFVKRDTPQDVVSRLNAALNAAMQDPTVKDSLAHQNIEVSAPMSAEQADAMYRAETERFREISSHMKLAGSQ